MNVKSLPATSIINSIVKTFKSKGLRPVQTESGSGKSADAARALVLSSRSKHAKSHRSAVQRLAQIVGDAEFVDGLVQGWDAPYDVPSTGSNSYRRGHLVGRKSYTQVRDWYENECQSDD